VILPKQLRIVLICGFISVANLANFRVNRKKKVILKALASYLVLAYI